MKHTIQPKFKDGYNDKQILSVNESLTSSRAHALHADSIPEFPGKAGKDHSLKPWWDTAIQWARRPSGLNSTVYVEHFWEFWFSLNESLTLEWVDHGDHKLKMKCTPVAYHMKKLCVKMYKCLLLRSNISSTCVKWALCTGKHGTTNIGSLQLNKSCEFRLCFLCLYSCK